MEEVCAMLLLHKVLIDWLGDYKEQCCNVNGMMQRMGKTRIRENGDGSF